MVVLIATFAGVTDLRALIAVAGANAAMILFGLVMERVNLGRERLDWLPGRAARTWMPGGRADVPIQVARGVVARAR